MSNKLLLLIADSVLFLHILVVVFVVFGLIAVIIGGMLKCRYKWRWVKNPWFRMAHLICIVVVVAQAWAGVVCPLTTLEMWLRNLAGEASYSGSFISHWMDQLLYYDLPTWAFTLIYTVFGALVVASWFWVRPRAFRATQAVAE